MNGLTHPPTTLTGVATASDEAIGEAAAAVRLYSHSTAPALYGLDRCGVYAHVSGKKPVNKNCRTTATLYPSPNQLPNSTSPESYIHPQINCSTVAAPRTECVIFPALSGELAVDSFHI
jgi:hypothetical protein